MRMRNLYQEARVDMIHNPGTITTGVIPTTWLDMSDYDRVVFLIALGSTDNNFDAVVRQGTSSAGAGAKDVSYVNNAGSTVTAQITQLDGNDDNKYVSIEVPASKLDIANGFRYVALSCTVAGTTTAAIWAIRYPARNLPVTQPTAWAEAVELYETGL